MSGADAEKLSRRRQLLALARDPERRRRLLALGAAIALGAVLLLALLAELLVLLPLDEWFTREAQEHAWAPLAQTMYLVSLAGYTPWSALVVAAGAALVAGLLGWRAGLYLAAITIAQGLLNAAIKLAVGRPRPVSGVVEVFVPEQGFSFPSGHVMFYTVFFGFLAFLALAHAPRGRRALLAAPPAAMVLLVGPSRIILGAHWLSDVVAAYLIGLLLLALAVELYLSRVRQLTPA